MKGRVPPLLSRYFASFVVILLLARALFTDGWADAAEWALLIGVVSKAIGELVGRMFQWFQKTQR